jgi:maltoporin
MIEIRVSTTSISKVRAGLFPSQLRGNMGKSPTNVDLTELNLTRGILCHSSRDPYYCFFLFLIFCLIATTPVSATEFWSNDKHEFGSHVYIRAGLATSEGETQACFKAPGASSKYRFGNECEAWGDLAAYYHYSFDNDEGEGEASYIHYEFMRPFEWAYGGKLEFPVHEKNYLEFGNIAGTPVKVSIGRRKFRRREIHISEFWYVDPRGDGVFIEDIPLGFASLGYTYLTDKQTPEGLAEPERVRQDNHDLNLYDIETNAGGSLALNLRFSRIEGDNFGSVNIHSANGWAIGAEHKQKNVLGGTNTLSVQYGQGAARSVWFKSFENVNALGRLTSATAATDLEKADTWRLVNHHLYEGANWNMQSAVVWEDKKSVAFDGTNQTWVSIGARPAYYIDQHWRGTVEVGLDYVNDKAAASDGYLLKTTVALEWAPEHTFFSRPALRFYVTNAFWSNSFVGQIGGPIYENDNYGWNAGVQLEWW